MSKKILIVDDEELIIRSLTKLLEKEGYSVLVVKNGADALAMTEEEDFDLIIADIRMPGINGVDTIASIFEDLEQKQKNKIPVIFITGYADKEVEEKAKTLKPAAYIYKPFDISTLVNKVKEVVDK